MTTLFDGIPERFRHAEFADLDPEVMDCVLDYIGHFGERVKARRGLLLSGPPGVGKTYAIAALTKHYVRRVKRPTWEFETAYRLVERYAPVVVGPGSKDPVRGQPWTKTYEEVFWLVINDLGKDYRGGKLQEQVAYKIGRLLRERNERKLPIFITTNLPLEPKAGARTFRQVYGDSVCSLLGEMVDSFVVEGPDRRTQEEGT